MKSRLVFLILILILLGGCASNNAPGTNIPGANTPGNDSPGTSLAVDRESKIPTDAVKVTQEADLSPPKSYSAEYEQPVPLPYPINTAGAEDSAFILPDGKTLYFFFTPDVQVPVEQQIIDGVTGIYMARKVNGQWQQPERVVLQDPGKISGDGCEFVMGNTMWFCTVREGYTGIHWFTAQYMDGKWQDWRNADFDPDYEVGELHIAGNELYFHSSRDSGKGGLDIWVSRKQGGEWAAPENVAAVNTENDEGWPALSPDGTELWISRNYGIWRSKKVNGEWTEAERMFSPLAGEATIDSAGNVYFTHHFYRDDEMIEADIYVAYHK